MVGKVGRTLLYPIFLGVASVHGAAIYKCQDDEGAIVYRDQPCPDRHAMREIDDSTFSVTGRGGLSEREWAEFDRLREERAARARARLESSRTQHDTWIGFEDRLRLRELRMRRGAIIDSLDRGRVPVGQAIILRQELEEIGRQEEAILSPAR